VLVGVEEFGSSGSVGSSFSNYLPACPPQREACQEIAPGARLVQTISPCESPRDRPNPGQDYLYLRLSQKEPFDILYVTLSLTTIINLRDPSFSIAIEVAYTGITTLELRFKARFLVGGGETEFGEKPNDYRLEFRAGYYF
jgi:hypothetical protein